MRACISACSCIPLTSKELLEIAVPLFAAFMEGEKKKGEGRKSFLGAGAPALCIFLWTKGKEMIQLPCNEYFAGMKSR